MLAVGMALAGTVCAGDDANTNKTKPAPAPVAVHGFYARYLAPEVSSRLTGERTAAIDFTNPTANPWTKDNRTVTRIENDAISATQKALKAYVIQELGIDKWSLPLTRGGGMTLGTGTGTGMGNVVSGGTRLRFGFANLAPRAEVLIPVNAGRVAFSADARGRIATSFDSHAANFRVGFSFDAHEHSGVFSLSRSF
jgi:hypothetical protein